MPIQQTSYGAKRPRTIASLPAPAVDSPTARVYDSLIFSTFQQIRESTHQGVVVAFTSANSGEGVTSAVTGLVDALSRDGSSRILQADSRRLSKNTSASGEIAQHCLQVDTRIYEFLGGGHAEHAWAANWEYRRGCIEELRHSFDYVLIDCPALGSAGDILSLAPLVDGIILVVEANTTRVDQILHAEKNIDYARGKLLGHILNKRSYTVPEWLYKLL